MPCARQRRRPSPTSGLATRTELGILSSLVDRAVNRTAHPGRLAASERALAIHQRGPIVDLLMGSALFRDDFVTRTRHGQVDLPRLRVAGVKVIGLTVATRFPDLRGTLSNWHFRSLGAPASALRTNMALAEWLIGRIAGWADESDDELRLVSTRADLDACLAPAGPVGIVLVVQGGHVLDGDLRNVERLAELGVRVLAPAHVMDNALVGSGTGATAGGLTSYGREVMAELEEHEIIVDLAHMSRAGIEVALPSLRRPFLLSHTGLTEVAGASSRWRRYSAATRNVSSSIAAEVGRRGGLVGVVLASQLLGGDELGDAVRTIRVAIDTAGEASVAIGSDMDGALRTVIDVEGLPALTTALLDAGLPESTVAGVMGTNAVSFFERALPS
jgi:membrane dipeptidase